MNHRVPAARSILQTASNLLVKERIRHHRKVKAITLSNISTQLQQLNSTLDHQTFTKLRAAQTDANNKLEGKTKDTHKKKLELLMMKKNNPSTNNKIANNHVLVTWHYVTTKSQSTQQEQVQSDTMEAVSSIR